MPNPTTHAAQVGFDVFRSSDPPPPLEAINEALAAKGLDGVAARTYNHYSRLVRHGYDEYMPINELDMAIKAKRRGH
jgi:hypothetical protein